MGANYHGITLGIMEENISNQTYKLADLSVINDNNDFKSINYYIND